MPNYVSKIKPNGLGGTEYTIKDAELREVVQAMQDEVAGTQTATGNPITLTDASETYAQGLSVEFEPKQDLHGYDFPWVGGAGKNKADIHFSISDSYCDAAVSLSAGQYIASFFDQNFTHDGIVSGVNFSCFLMDGNGQNIKYNVQNGTTLTAEEASQITTLRYYFDRGQYSGTSTEFYGQLETGNTVTDYAPYSNLCPISGYEGVDVTTADSATDPTQSRTASVTFGQTVYGGSVDVTDGGTDDEYEIVTFDGSSDETWDKYDVTEGNLYRTVLSDRKQGDLATVANAISNEFMPIWQNIRTDNTLSGGYIFADVIKNDIETVEAWRTFLASNPLQVCYKKATPTTIATPPTELKLLQDINNITTNGTTITLDYIPNNSIGDAVKASEEYTDRAVERVAVDPKATLIDTWMISEESDTISVDLTSYDCNFFLLEYLFMSKRGTTLIPRPQSGTFSASVVTYNNGTALYIELDYNPTTKELAYTSNITSQFGILAIYTI